MNNKARLLDKVRFCDATEVPERALQDFYGRMFPGKSHLLNQHWRWLYRLDRFPGARSPLVAVLDGAVVGQVSQIPVTLKMGDRKQLAAWGVDYGVLPEYRGSGIGYRINLLWMERYPIYLAVCTPASFRIIQQQGWTTRQTVLDLRLPLHPERHQRFRTGVPGMAMRIAGPCWHLLYRIRREVQTPGGDMPRCRPLVPGDLAGWSLLRHPGQTGGVVSVPRDPDYLNWRLVESPLAGQYRLLQVGDSPVSAIVRTVNRRGMRRLRVIALSGRIIHKVDLDRFFCGLLRWAFRSRVDSVRIVTGDPLVLEVARRWLPIRKTLRFGYYCTGDADSVHMKTAEFRWELLDSDFDLLT
jgi:hypothetical protein